MTELASKSQEELYQLYENKTQEFVNLDDSREDDASIKAMIADLEEIIDALQKSKAS